MFTLISAPPPPLEKYRFFFFLDSGSKIGAVPLGWCPPKFFLPSAFFFFFFFFVFDGGVLLPTPRLDGLTVSDLGITTGDVRCLRLTPEDGYLPC